MLSFDQQRKRFERQHKKASPITCDYTCNDIGFVDPNINATFLGWMLAITAQKSDEVVLSYHSQDGWRFLSAETGFTVHCQHPKFKNYIELDKAVEWAKEQGLIITEIDD